MLEGVGAVLLLGGCVLAGKANQTTNNTNHLQQTERASEVSEWSKTVAGLICLGREEEKPKGMG